MECAFLIPSKWFRADRVMAADFVFVYKNLAVGGGIFTHKTMEEVAAVGITHIIDAQAEFDDTPLAKPFGIEVCWCPTFDDFSTPDSHLFVQAADFINKALETNPNAKFLAHCAAGVHRGPMFGLLAACMLGHDIKKAEGTIYTMRHIASFPKVYQQAVEKFVGKQGEK